MHLKPASTLDFSAVKYWMLGKRKISRFHLELGYAFPLVTSAYTVKEEGYQLTDLSKRTLRITQPGGLILATGFTFGVF